jgi:hypothetical protein
MFSPNATINKDATATIVVDADTPSLGASHTAFLADGTSVSYSKHPMPFLGYNPLIASLMGTGTENTEGISSVPDGRVTPSFELQGVTKGGETGKDDREKGAVAYCAAEHTALLTYIIAMTDSFNASESSEEWKKVYKAMVKGYYMNLGLMPCQSTTLQSHFVDIHSGLKPGIHGLLLLVGSPKCPVKFDIDNAEVQSCCTFLFDLIVSDSKKYFPNKWWSLHVVSLLLQLHLQYTQNYSLSQ